MLSRGLPRAFREHLDSHGFHAVQFNREFAQCLQLAKNTDKEVFFKIRSKAKDTICLVCAISLIGERCTFNIEQHSGLRQKLESVLEHDIDFKASSSRICRPCGPWKKFHVVMEQVQELRGKFMSACRKNFTHTVKRMSKAMVLRQKLTKNLARAGCLYRLRKTIAKKILQKAFNSCPTTTVWNAASHPN